jgi:hypothetical protein
LRDAAANLCNRALSQISDAFLENGERVFLLCNHTPSGENGALDLNNARLACPLRPFTASVGSFDRTEALVDVAHHVADGLEPLGNARLQRSQLGCKASFFEFLSHSRLWSGERLCDLPSCLRLLECRQHVCLAACIKALLL